MGCAVQKQSKQATLKQYDPKLQQIVTVPVLYDAKSNPIVKRRHPDNGTDRTPTKQ